MEPEQFRQSSGGTAPSGLETAERYCKKGEVMPARRGKSTLEKWEIALVKAMLARGGWNDQEILAYFTRPTRSVNHRVIGEIRTETKHKAIRPASLEDLDEFLSTWPDVDPQTGLSLRGDELLIKAREAMIAAVHTFNGAGLNFRAELFIVTSIIAWTYLLHAWLRREASTIGTSRTLMACARSRQPKTVQKNTGSLGNVCAATIALWKKASGRTSSFSLSCGTRSSTAPPAELTMRSARSCKPAASTSTKRSRGCLVSSTVLSVGFQLRCNS